VSLARASTAFAAVVAAAAEDVRPALRKPWCVHCEAKASKDAVPMAVADAGGTNIA